MLPTPGSLRADARPAITENQNKEAGSGNECGVYLPIRKARVGLRGGKGRRYSVAERLAARTDKSGGPDACWPVSGYRTGRGGYVQLMVDSTTRQRDYAHRISYALTFGPIPLGKVICHRCDNPICVNPAHLFAATQAENIRDSHAKGRFTRWHTTKRRLNGVVAQRYAHLLDPSDLLPQGGSNVLQGGEFAAEVVNRHTDEPTDTAGVGPLNTVQGAQR